MAQWNEKCQKTDWITTSIEPSDKNLKELWTMSAAELFAWKFPADSIFRTRPQNIKDMDWNNHLNSLVAMICGIKKFFVEN